MYTQNRGRIVFICGILSPYAVKSRIRLLIDFLMIPGEENPFMRTGSLEDATEYWVSVRSELTQDYKRKRKDAVRRQTKLAAKRTKVR